MSTVQVDLARQREIVQAFFVTPGWAADFYGVSPLKIYRAIHSGQLKAVTVQGGRGRRPIYILDIRTLPSELTYNGYVEKEAVGA
jgi:hypothetical protein